MQTRLAKIIDAQAYTSDQVVVQNLFLTEPISAIYIEAKCLNNGNTPTAHPAAAVSKVEIVDGSTVIHSLSGKQIQARQFYGTGKYPENVANYIDNEYSTAPLVIHFGRKLGDEKYALDPARFKQLQLRITLDIGAGGAACDSITLDVDAYVFDQKAITPEGYLCAKEYYKYSLVSSAIEDIDLPRDRKLRSVTIESEYSGKYPYEQFNHIKLTEDNDRRIPFDIKTSHFVKFLAAIYGKVTEHVCALVSTSGVSIPCGPTYEAFAPGVARDATAAYFSQSGGNGGIVTIKGSADVIFDGVVSGLAPHGAVVLPFGDKDDPDSWLDPTKIGSLRLKLTAGSLVGASSTCQVVVESVEAY